MDVTKVDVGPCSLFMDSSSEEEMGGLPGEGVKASGDKGKKIKSMTLSLSKG